MKEIYPVIYFPSVFISPAGLLAVLSLLHITSSALGIRGSCQMSNATDSVGESLLNTRPENYDRFEEVLVSIYKLKKEKKKKKKNIFCIKRLTLKILEFLLQRKCNLT